VIDKSRQEPSANTLDWEDRFRNNSTPWERPGLHPAFKFWRQSGALQAGQRVIIPGCGRAPEPLAFAQLGLEVCAADLSKTALNWQADQFAAADLEADLIEGDTLAHGGDGLFDLVYEQTFLCAISPKLRHDYETALLRWLKPGGSLLALFMQKDEPGGPPYGCSLEAMRGLFPSTRWDWPDLSSFRPFPHPSLDGKPELAGILIRR
jgi:SAM-dependent methyltransferase